MERFVVRGDVKPGAQLAQLDAAPERQYANLAGDVNPLAYLAADRQDIEPLVVNLFRTVADYYVDDVFASIETESLDQDQQLQIRTAIRFAMLYGNCPVVPLNGRALAASPRGYWPILEQGAHIGDALIIPYNTSSHSGSLNASMLLPNRATVFEVYDGQDGRIYDCAYSGVTLAAYGWQRIGTFPAMGVIQAGRPMFPAIRPIVEAFDRVMKSTLNVIERHGKPHLQVPTAVLQYDERGKPDIAFDSRGTVFPVGNQDKDVKYVQPQAARELPEFAATQLLTHLSAMSGVPLATFNIAALPRLETATGLGEYQSTGRDRSKSILQSVIAAFGVAGIRLTALPEPQPQPIPSPSGAQ